MQLVALPQDSHLLAQVRAVFDLVVDRVSANHRDPSPFLALKRSGYATLNLVGPTPSDMVVSFGTRNTRRRSANLLAYSAPFQVVPESPAFL